MASVLRNELPIFQLNIFYFSDLFSLNFNPTRQSHSILIVLNYCCLLVYCAKLTLSKFYLDALCIYLCAAPTAIDKQSRLEWKVDAKRSNNTKSFHGHMIIWLLIIPTHLKTVVVSSISSAKQGDQSKHLWLIEPFGACRLRCFIYRDVVQSIGTRRNCFWKRKKKQKNQERREMCGALKALNH